MAHPLSDAEKAILRLHEAEGRIASLKARIALLKGANRPTEVLENLLATHQQSLELMRAHLARLNAPMIVYRCYFMSGEIIRRMLMLECPDDAEALIKSTALLKSKPEHQRVEIWQGERYVALLSRDTTPQGAPAMRAEGEIMRLIEDAFRPLRCEAESWDYGERIRYRVYGSDGSLLLQYSDLTMREALSGESLPELLIEARQWLEARGYQLQPWQFPQT